MLTKENKQILLKRLKSLAWRSVMIGVAFGLGFLTENIGLFGMSEFVTVTVGLILGELTKELNNRYDLEKYLRLAKS